MLTRLSGRGLRAEVLRGIETASSAAVLQIIAAWTRRLTGVPGNVRFSRCENLLCQVEFLGPKTCASASASFSDVHTVVNKDMYTPQKLIRSSCASSIQWRSTRFLLWLLLPPLHVVLSFACSVASLNSIYVYNLHT